MQRQGYPSTVHVWGAAVRANFVPFGDGGVVDPGRHVAVRQHKASRQSVCKPITQHSGLVVGTRIRQGFGRPGLWSSGALVVRGVGRPGRWSSGALVVRGVGRPGRQTVKAASEHGFGCWRAMVGEDIERLNHNNLHFGENEA